MESAGKIKRTSEKSFKRIEKKRQKVKAFLDLIEGKTGIDGTIAKSDAEGYVSAIQELRDLRKKTQELYKTTPFFKLLENGVKARRKDCEEPLSHWEIQSLLLSSLIPKYYQPQQPFYELQRSQCASKVAIFILDGIDINFTHEESTFFTEVVKYEAGDEDWVTRLLYVPVSNRKIETKEILKVKPELKEKLREVESPRFTPVKRTELLLSLKQMALENYPLPDESAIYTPTKESYTPVTNKSPMYGLDCEMCLTVKGNSEVTHIALVDENMDVLLKTHVKPDDPIKDYLTRWSGVTKEHLENCDVTLKSVHEQLRQILPSDAILVGQSLNFDLKALKLMHPYVIDTSCIYNFSGNRGTKPGLKLLSSMLLDEQIQTGNRGHCPSEDAAASLKLAQLKLSKGLEFGDRRFGLKDGISSKYLPLVSYADLFDIRVNVFYDYLELEDESKFVCVMTSYNKNLMPQIMRALSTDKCICLVITNELCCIRV